MKKIALVTGATAGIGVAISKRLSENGYNLIITGRREKRLLSFAEELKSSGVDVLPLCFDVCSSSQVEHFLGSLPEPWRTIDVLVNNAGLAVGLNPLNEGIIDDWERMLNTNVKGLLYVSKIVSNLMIAQGKGHIVNLCSIAGKEVYPNGNVYCASKHAVDAITKGLRMDLLKYGIKVSQICPGAVETEFSEVRFKGDKERAANVYKGYTPLSAEDIADAIFYIVNTPAHVNINDMIIMPTAQANSSIFFKQ